MMKHILLILILFGFSYLGHAQSVSGTVTDENGDAIIGAAIMEKGTSNGTVTDFDGKYSITLTSGDASLVFSYTGYGTTEETVGGRTTVDVTMVPDQVLGEVQVVGSRSYNRSATQSPAGIDVIDVQSVSNATGRVEINNILQYTAPSFNATKQSGSDGADHIDPASLRGLGPDQTLVLINGKRRHQSSLVNVFGTRGRGNTGTDLNAIPAASIKRIEVLRDGASAQYGSDAIAGVINIVLKDNKGLTGGLTYGAYTTDIGTGYDALSGEDVFNINGKNRVLDKDRKFDGNTARIDLNYGLSLGDKGGYANFTAEYLTKDRTLRPGYSWRKGYGSAAADQFQFMLNSAYPLSEKTELVVFGGMGLRGTDAYAYSRSAAEEDERSVAALYPDGFTPHITSDINDNAGTIGLNHTFSNGWKASLSNTLGYNNFHYNITGTNNASLGPKSPTSFDAGGHNLLMNVTGLDFSKYNESIASGLNLAFGAEFRTERFKIFAGEEASYATYDVNGKAITDPATQLPYVNEFGVQAPGGSQGFPGYSPDNVVNEGRTNLGIYADAELNATEAWLITGALRFENYSDFGSTFNYKLASRYKISDMLALRASLSTGFRAPSLAQIHYNLIFNDIVGGESQLTLLASNTSDVARGFGIQELKQETAQNIAAGFTFKTGPFTATIDGYSIKVKDRIILTDVFDASDLDLGVEAAQFFANGIDTKTQGVDIVLNYRKSFDNGNASFNFGVAGNINDTEIEKINNGNLNRYTFFSPFSQAYLEAAAPDYKFAVSAGTSQGKFDIQVNYTLFSKVTLQDYQWVDSPATTDEEAAALYEIASDVYDRAGTIDVSLGYQIAKKMKFTLGSNNIFNTYPTPQFDTWTDQGGFNDSVQMGSDGRFLFGRLSFNF